MFDTHVPTHKVLIVDDQYVPRSLESLALEGTGRYFTVEAGNGTDAITLMSGERFDCAVIDFSMPDMTGVELISRIRWETCASPCTHSRRARVRMSRSSST